MRWTWGRATDLGSRVFFMGVWMPMMAAMMLPGAAPAVSSFVRANGRAVVAPLFAGSYLALWTLVGLADYAAYQPHGSSAAGTLTIAAGLDELTPLKRNCRRRCRERVRSGFEFGLDCVGSSAGLMVVLVALGVMSVTLMAVVAAPTCAALDQLLTEHQDVRSARSRQETDEPIRGDFAGTLSY